VNNFTRTSLFSFLLIKTNNNNKKQQQQQQQHKSHSFFFDFCKIERLELGSSWAVIFVKQNQKKKTPDNNNNINDNNDVTNGRQTDDKSRAVLVCMNNNDISVKRLYLSLSHSALLPGVNFINLLRAHFSYKNWRQKFKAKK